MAVVVPLFAMGCFLVALGALLLRYNRQVGRVFDEAMGERGSIMNWGLPDEGSRHIGVCIQGVFALVIGAFGVVGSFFAR